MNAVKVEGKNVTFSIGIGSLTIKNGKGKQITLTDGNGSTTSQKYNESKSNISSGYVAPVEDTWFTATNNSISELDDIMQPASIDYSVEQLNTTDKLNQQAITVIAANKTIK